MRALNHAARADPPDRADQRRVGFVFLLEESNRRHGPRPGQAGKPAVIAVIVLNKARPRYAPGQARSPARPPTSLLLKEPPSYAGASARPRAHRLAAKGLPKYPPELNAIDPVLGELTARLLPHQTFADRDTRNHALPTTVTDLNTQRARHPLAKPEHSAEPF